MYLCVTWITGKVAGESVQSGEPFALGLVSHMDMALEATTLAAAIAR